jgi:Zn-dependent protease
MPTSSVMKRRRDLGVYHLAQFFCRTLAGYAKPVPVNFRAPGHSRIRMVLVAAAGPGMNIGLSVIAALSFHLVVYLSLINEN